MEPETETETMKDTDEAGITHNCGVFGCISSGEWPTQIDVAQIICLGLVALQHRFVLSLFLKYVSYPYILYKKRKEKEIKVIPFSTFPMVICTCNELMCVSFTLYTLLVCVCTCMFVYVRIVYCPLFYNTFNLFVQMTCFQGKVTFSISRGKSSETCYSLCYSPMKFIYDTI